MTTIAAAFFRKMIRSHLLGVAVVLALLLSQLPTPAAAATALKYTALGDSLATGLWAFQGGYVPWYRSYVQTDTGATVSLTNLGQNGWTSTDLLNALKTNGTFRTSVSGSQMVTWNIGGNDFLNARNRYKNKTCGGADNQDCLRAAVTTFVKNWEAIRLEIRALRTTDGTLTPTIIRTMNVYNPYVNADKSANTWPNDAGNDFQVFKPYIDGVNGYIAVNSTNNGIPYADVYRAFNGPNGDIDPRTYRYISWDGLHPNDAGHKKMADLLRELKYAPLK